MDAPEIFRNLVKMVVQSKKRGFQSELAQKCGVDPKHLSDFLGGRSVLSESKRIAIVETLGYEYDEFLSIGKNGAEIGADGKLKPSTFIQKVQRIYSRACDVERVSGDMLERFNNKKLARQCIDRLVEIDSSGPAKLERVDNFLYGYLEGIKSNGAPEKMNGEKKTGTKSS